MIAQLSKYINRFLSCSLSCLALGISYIGYPDSALARDDFMLLSSSWLPISQGSLRGCMEISLRFLNAQSGLDEIAESSSYVITALYGNGVQEDAIYLICSQDGQAAMFMITSDDDFFIPRREKQQLLNRLVNAYQAEYGK